MPVLRVEQAAQHLQESGVLFDDSDDPELFQVSHRLLGSAGQAVAVECFLVVPSEPENEAYEKQQTFLCGRSQPSALGFASSQVP